MFKTIFNPFMSSFANLLATKEIYKIMKQTLKLKAKLQELNKRTKLKQNKVKGWK